mgnify:CR=1 FL=1
MPLRIQTFLQEKVEQRPKKTINITRIDLLKYMSKRDNLGKREL